MTILTIDINNDPYHDPFFFIILPKLFSHPILPKLQFLHTQHLSPTLFDSSSESFSSTLMKNFSLSFLLPNKIP